ncbi:MAG: DPP IV N-terminal domain-containing protein, partial [Chthonomonadales bacterium]
TDGNEKARTKSGIGSWVYGEELFQSSAFWWSPDSKKIAYYRFDESNVIDYPLQVKQLALQSDTYTEPYPKAGKPNPIVDVFVYDVATKKSTRMDIRDGKPFTNDSVGHYVYGISWTPDSSELLMHRTNRKQNSMEYVAANPNTGTLRLIFREDWPASWTENSPQIRWLKDGKRFILRSERNGFHNFYLYDVSGKLIATITNLQAEVATIVRLEEDKNVMYYMARDGDNHMKMQLHRVGLDGKGEVRMTDPAFNHTVSLSPDGSEFVDVIQTHNSPPATRVVKADGTVLLKIATSDITAFTDQGYQPAEVFPYKSIDGIETCWGTISYPSHFDPKKKYPLLVLVYGGPATSSVSETFAAPSSTCDLGFIVAAFDGRNSSGRGKRLLDQLYLHLGGPEIDDQAAGVMVLRERPYVDGNRIGIYGTSYGGFASAMCLLRYPDVFTAASASSAVTAWNHYDSIYTERYMWLPEENADGYKFGSAMTYAKDKKGRLLIYYGTADDNVHPNNSMQLISALQRAGKSFEVQVGPDQGHSGVNFDRMMEFFYDAFGIR